MLRRFFPVLSWLPAYKKSYLQGDIAAGFTVGIMLIPQGMAYAMIAGLPPVLGLYAALVPQIIYALMGTSRQLSVGPVAMDSLLVASGLGALSLSGIDEYIAMALFLALFMGSIQLLLGLLKMGFLVNFLSRPVISGFTSAAAIIIGLSQLKHLLGVPVASSNQLQVLLQNLLAGLEDTHLFTLGIGVGAIIVMKVVHKLNDKVPAALVVVVLAILGVYFLGWEAGGLQLVGRIPEGLPVFQTPRFDFSRLGELFPIAMALALIAFMEAISVAKAVEEKQGSYRLDANQELVALGTANIVGSFFQSYPTTGGFSRTAVNEQAGAKTGVASMVSALVVGATLLFLTPLFYYLPQTILAAIIMVAVFGLIDLQYPRELLRDRRDEFALLLLTFVITLLVGIKEGILLGVLISLLLLVYRTSKPHIAVLGRIRGTHYFKNIQRFNEDTEVCDDVLILRFDGQLYFGNQEYFRNELYRHMSQKGQQLRYVILNAEAINYADSSAVILLKRVIADLKAKGITLMLAGAIGPLRDILYSSGLIHQIGKENLFVSTSEAFDHCRSSSLKSAIEDKVATQSKKSGIVT